MDMFFLHKCGISTGVEYGTICTMGKKVIMALTVSSVVFGTEAGGDDRGEVKIEKSSIVLPTYAPGGYDKMPVVETLDIVRSDATSVTIQGEVMKENGAPVTEAGFCWGTGSDFTFASGQAQKAAERKGKYEAHIEGLQANQDYYIRAYAINAVDTAFGETLSFHTADGLLEQG